MGEVYRARDPRLERQVAIKLLPAEMAADHNARERLRSEAMAAAALDHPYICKVFEIGEHDGARIPGDGIYRRRNAGSPAACRPDAASRGASRGRRDRRGA